MVCGFLAGYRYTRPPEQITSLVNRPTPLGVHRMLAVAYAPTMALLLALGLSYLASAQRCPFPTC